MNVPINSSPSRLPAKCRRIFAGLACVGLLAAGTVASQGAAVVFSETFEGDPTSLGLDVSTDYTLVTPPFATNGPGSLVGEGALAKVTDAALTHYLWPTRLAPGGVGQFLAVNGFTAANKTVYKKTGINVVAGNSYTFQADLVALFPEAPANLQFAIEFFNGAVSTGVTVLSPVVVPDFSVLGWGTTVVNMGAAPVGADKATITLNNAITAASGNDFGVDNIIITDTTAPPPPPPPTTNCVVVAGCEPTTNPAGKHIPTAGNNPKSGQNPDGFYQLMAASFCPNPGNLQVYVKDSASSFIAGPFLPGAKVKITQAPGVTANSKPMAGVIVAHIQLKGDALVCAYDPVNKVWSEPSSCLVPPKPK